MRSQLGFWLAAWIWTLCAGAGALTNQKPEVWYRSATEFWLVGALALACIHQSEVKLTPHGRNIPPENSLACSLSCMFWGTTLGPKMMLVEPKTCFYNSAMDVWTDRKIDSLKDRQIGRYADRQIDRQTENQIGRYNPKINPIIRWSWAWASSASACFVIFLVKVNQSG